MTEPTIAALIKRLETSVAILESVAYKVSQKDVKSSVDALQSKQSLSDSGDKPASVTAFIELQDTFLAPYLTLSGQLGDIVAKQSAHVKQAFENLKNIIKQAAASKKPAADILAKLAKPLNDEAGKAIQIAEENRKSPLFNHVSCVSSGLPALAWIGVEPAPCPYINEMKDSAQFYSNRIIKEFKEKDKLHVDFANSFITLLAELSAYVKKYHTTGLYWNPKGGDATAATPAAAAAPVPPPAPAGPPLPPAPGTLPKNPAPASAPAPSLTGVFAQLNVGENVTAGLKKVDKSQMTHKNPELRASSVVKADDIKPAEVKKTTLASTAVKKEPKLALEGSKWLIENQVKNNSIVLSETDIRQVVNIYNCQESVIKVEGKINAVSIVNCQKVALVVNDVVSTVDIVNSKSMQVQIMKNCPTVAIDKTDGCIVYLSKTSLNTEILTAKSSELNVCVPGKTDNDDFIERPVPEQFKTTIVNGNMVTVAVEHSGG